jgi:hypothetical protein
MSERRIEDILESITTTDRFGHRSLFRSRTIAITQKDDASWLRQITAHYG